MLNVIVIHIYDTLIQTLQLLVTLGEDESVEGAVKFDNDLHEVLLALDVKVHDLRHVGLRKWPRLLWIDVRRLMIDGNRRHSIVVHLFVVLFVMHVRCFLVLDVLHGRFVVGGRLQMVGGVVRLEDRRVLRCGRMRGVHVWLRRMEHGTGQVALMR